MHDGIDQLVASGSSQDETWNVQEYQACPGKLQDMTLTCPFGPDLDGPGPASFVRGEQNGEAPGPGPGNP